MLDKSFGVKPGQKWVHGRVGIDKELKIMAVIDGWAMMRYPGCRPFVEYCRDMAQGESWVLVRDTGVQKAIAGKAKADGR